ncbi:hypothetical protein V1506DRAFT_113671 [Lipomyces tetrasporus]
MGDSLSDYARVFMRVTPNLPERLTASESLSRFCAVALLLFGQGPERVALPSALLCNIHLAVGRALRASGAAETIDKILKYEEDLNCGNLEGDYGLRVSASYLERELRALQGVDELAIDRQDGIMDSDSEEDLPATTRHTICT